MSNELNLGPQPILQLLARHELAATDLVRASEDQLTHKMVARAVKGRRLTPNVMGKVLRALNRAAESDYGESDLFTYAPPKKSPRAVRAEVRDGGEDARSS